MSAISFSISVVDHFTADAALDVKTVVLKAVSDDCVEESIELESADDLLLLRNCINTFFKANNYELPAEP